MIRILVGGITMGLGLFALAQQQPEASSKPSVPEILVLIECEDAIYGKQERDTRIRSGIFDVVSRQWLITGGKRDQVINCLVDKHGWAAVSAPDGRRGARPPR